MKGNDYCEFDLALNPSPCRRRGCCSCKSSSGWEESQGKSKACSSPCRGLFYSRGSPLLCSAQCAIHRDLECRQAAETLADRHTGHHQHNNLYIDYSSLVDHHPRRKEDHHVPSTSTGTCRSIWSQLLHVGSTDRR